MAKLVHVAVGVIYNADGKVLIAKRSELAHQGGLWEFPGGKVDAGESVAQALVRELREELAIDVTASEPLIQIRHHYPDKSVLLDVHRITRFSGVASGNEGQPIAWVTAQQLTEFDFPAANRPIITAIKLPSRYAITGGGADQQALVMRVKKVLGSGVKLLQLRIPDFTLSAHQALCDELAELMATNDASLQLNCSAEVFAQLSNSKKYSGVGLHLNRQQAALLDSRPVSENVLLGVSCHSAAEIEQAQKIKADYLLLSPVQPTHSHPDAAPLGWEQFSRLVERANVPVYALGGLGEVDLNIAQRHGAQGVAGISAWWPVE